MPVINGTTRQARESWKSPDGKITAWDIILDVDGTEFKTQTYSARIATIGWSGEADTYEKNGRTYVRQPQREGGWSGGAASSSPSRGKPPDNPHTMYLSYAKDILIAMLETKGFDQEVYDTLIASVAQAGSTLYGSRPGGGADEAVSTVAGDDPWAEASTLL